MIHNIGLLMVTEGLLTRQALEAAVARKRVEGGSLALNLVLVGAVDEVSLARFYADRLKLEPASEEVLAGVDRATFGLIPLEIIYESAILPLYLKDDNALVVGWVDPTDRDLLAEASFFAGYSLRPRMITVSQMARHFARLAGQSWRITVAEAEQLSMRPDEASAAELGIDALLEQTLPLDHAMESSLEASLDEAYHAADPTEMIESPWASTQPAPAAPADEPPQANIATMRLSSDGLPSDLTQRAPQAEQVEADELTPSRMSIWMGGRGAEEVSQIRIKAVGPTGSESGPIEVDQEQLERAVVSTAQLPALKLDEPPREEPLRRIDIDTSSLPIPSVGSEVATGVRESSDESWVEGEAVTSTGSVKIMGFRMDSAMQTAIDEPMREPSPVVSHTDHGFGKRPKTKVPARKPAGGSAVSITEHVHLLTRLGTELGGADPSVAASIRQIAAELKVVRKRDELGATVVAGLADWYPQVAVLTLNGPRAVVWRHARDAILDPSTVGETIDIVEGGVMHRVSQERVFYCGPLPADSRLREGLGIKHDNDVLVAPVEMRGKTILLLVMDAGPDNPLRSPGRRFERLLVDLAKGLERVILLRRRGRRK